MTDNLLDQIQRDNAAALRRLDDIEAALVALQQTVDKMNRQLDELRPATVDPGWRVSMERRAARWGLVRRV